MIMSFVIQVWDDFGFSDEEMEVCGGEDEEEGMQKF